MVLVSVPLGIAEASIVNISWSGLLAVASGAVIWICCPNGVE